MRKSYELGIASKDYLYKKFTDYKEKNRLFTLTKLMNICSPKFTIKKATQTGKKMYAMCIRHDKELVSGAYKEHLQINKNFRKIGKILEDILHERGYPNSH